jgi:hypothetical protein
MGTMLLDQVIETDYGHSISAGLIELDPAADLSMVELARAASLVPRALQLVFRRRLRTTPTAFRQQCASNVPAKQLQVMPDPTVRSYWTLRAA